MAVTKQKELVKSLLDKTKDDEASFIPEAKRLAESNPAIKYYETEYLTAFPEAWEPWDKFENLTKDKISSLFKTDEGLALFQVLDIGKPRIQSLEEVEDKIFRVLFSKKKRAHLKELKDQMLKEYNYKVTF
jgi:hypothetical protein